MGKSFSSLDRNSHISVWIALSYVGPKSPGKTSWNANKFIKCQIPKMSIHTDVKCRAKRSTLQNKEFPIKYKLQQSLLNNTANAADTTKMYLEKVASLIRISQKILDKTHEL